MSETENSVVETRRRQLKLWIDTHFAGSQKLFIASTNDGEKQINQGEISGLLRLKSFGEKRARALERQARMPDGYLDERPNPYPQTPAPIAPEVREPQPSYSSAWPFSKVTAQRLNELRRQLGPQKFSAALADMDEMLESTVIKWERREEIDIDKSAAA